MVDHDLIRPRHEVANDVKAAIEICEDKQVFTFAPGKVVAPCSAIHDVVAGTGIDRIATTHPEKKVRCN
jgi:hypothetical protein